MITRVVRVIWIPTTVRIITISWVVCVSWILMIITINNAAKVIWGVLDLFAVSFFLFLFLFLFFSF